MTLKSYLGISMLGLLTAEIHFFIPIYDFFNKIHEIENQIILI